MKSFQRILSGLNFFIIVMLLFLLLFQNKVSLPPILQATGRMHPLLLHLPIGLLIISFILWIGRKNIDPDSFRKIFILVLQLTAFTAALTAIMGFFLSKEGGYDQEILAKHKFLGITTALLSYVILYIYKSAPEKKLLFGAGLTLSLVVLVFGSHFGSNLTHGEGYVFQPLQKENGDEPLVITDSTTLFAAAIRPILKSKCFSCHNERKQKGELVMTTEEKLLKGGKNGPIWNPGDALNSHIIQNINLPEEDKKHMPPNGKPQLSPEEIQLLHTWIQSGADMKKTIKEFDDKDTLMMLAANFFHTASQPKEKKYPFAAASASVVSKLISPFCSIFPLSQTSPALRADFFVREKFERQKLEDILKVKEQLVVLNLDNMPVTDEDMKFISQLGNLEKLILNNSSVSNKGLNEIKNLKQLQSLSLSGTAIDTNAASVFGQMDSLKEVFIWNTKISRNEAERLQREYPQIIFNLGYIPDAGEILMLNPPIIKNENFILGDGDKIKLEHKIAGVQIRYTTDGNTPDSTSSPVYDKPISVDGFTIVKARAVKHGWYSSPVIEGSFYKKGIKPTTAELVNQPNEKYKGEGAATLTDNKKGPAESFGDAAWLGFREKPFEAIFYFELARTINSIAFGYEKNVSSYIMPPEAVEIWGGDSRSNLKLIKSIKPQQPGKEEMNAVRAEGIKIEIPSSTYKWYKIIARNVSKLPAWHPGKGDKGWVFIDEVFFN